MLKLKQKTPPITEAISQNEVKVQLRIDADDTSYDDQLNVLIPAARQWCEDYQNRAYITQTWELALDCWPQSSSIRLPRPNLQSVDSVSIIDKSGNSTIWTEYLVDKHSEPGRLVGVWPSGDLAKVNAITIEYTSGYGQGSEDVPEKIRQAIILLTLHWFENGMCEPPQAVKWLLAQDRVIPI